MPCFWNSPKKTRKDLFTIGFSKRSSTVENIKGRGQISTVNDVFHYSLNTDSLDWILTLQVRQQAKKAPDAWSPCVLATRNKNHFYMGPVCFCQNLASHATETIDRSGIFEHPNNSFQWIILLISYIKCFLWNNLRNLDEYS